MSRPMILEIEESKEEILAAVNNALSERKIPCYFLASFLTDVAEVVTAKAKAEVDFLKNKEEKK